MKMTLLVVFLLVSVSFASNPRESDDREVARLTIDACKMLDPDINSRKFGECFVMLINRPSLTLKMLNHTVDLWCDALIDTLTIKKMT